MTTQPSSGSEEQSAAADKLRQRSIQLEEVIKTFTTAHGRAPTYAEVDMLLRETRPDKVGADAIPPDTHDAASEYETFCRKTLLSVVVFLGFLFALMAIAALLAVRLGWM